MENERKTVQIFRASQMLIGESEEIMRERIRKGIESGIVILNPGAEYVGCLQYPDAEVILADAGENVADIAEGIAIETARYANSVEQGIAAINKQMGGSIQ